MQEKWRNLWKDLFAEPPKGPGPEAFGPLIAEAKKTFQFKGWQPYTKKEQEFTGKGYAPAAERGTVAAYSAGLPSLHPVKKDIGDILTNVVLGLRAIGLSNTHLSAMRKALETGFQAFEIP